MKTFTAFCQDADGGGTIWIGPVEADDLPAAMDMAAKQCAADWGYSDANDVHILGIASGDVKIEYWDDIEG